MIATMMDMRRNPRKILDALARNETVTLTDRGKPVGRIEPIEQKVEEDGEGPVDITQNPAFGMWADREDMKDPSEYVRRIRRGRFRDI